MCRRRLPSHVVSTPVDMPRCDSNTASTDGLASMIRHDSLNDLTGLDRHAPTARLSFSEYRDVRDAAAHRAGDAVAAVRRALGRLMSSGGPHPNLFIRTTSPFPSRTQNAGPASPNRLRVPLRLRRTLPSAASTASRARAYCGRVIKQGRWPANIRRVQNLRKRSCSAKRF